MQQVSISGAKLNISGIQFEFVSCGDIEEHGHAISERLTAGKTTPGTHNHHKFVPGLKNSDCQLTHSLWSHVG